MSTSTFLSNANIEITQGATTYDLSDQANSCTITVGFDSLESTAFSSASPAGRSFVPGLQSVEVSIDFFLSYGGSGVSSEVETALAAIVGQGNTSLSISPDDTAPATDSPLYEITGAMLASFTPVSSKVGELAMVTASFVGGTWTRSIA
jgi:hypothetical protein